MMKAVIISAKDSAKNRIEQTDASVVESGHPCDQFQPFNNFLAAVERPHNSQSTVIMGCR